METSVSAPSVLRRAKIGDEALTLFQPPACPDAPSKKKTGIPVVSVWALISMLNVCARAAPPLRARRCARARAVRGKRVMVVLGVTGKGAQRHPARGRPRVPRVDRM